MHWAPTTKRSKVTGVRDDPERTRHQNHTSRLHEARADWLRRNAAGLRNNPGRTYGRATRQQAPTVNYGVQGTKLCRGERADGVTTAS